MVVAQKPKTRFSAAEYLALEEEAEYRSEYYQGEIFAMSGGSANHNRIAGNLFVALRSALRGKPCEAFINDMRLQVKRHHLYTYPDVMVVCGKIEFAQGRNDT
ncbi:MAG: Uma2 family endonuclease, partial [Anaerolineae bacterium]|nr:Uma2 family endonuclease [Anaerolineae bacterium]